MTYANIDNTAIRTGDARPSILRRIGSALLDGLEFVATVGPRTEALRRLSGMSDERLAALGTTRDAEVRRIVGIHAYL